MSICVWFTSLSIMCTRFTDGTACVQLCFFSWLSISCLSRPLLLTHPCADECWVVSTFWLLWIMLLWSPTDKNLFKSLLSVLLDTYVGVQLLGYMLILYVAVSVTAILFSTMNAPFYIEKYKGPNFSTSMNTVIFYSCPNGYEVVTHCNTSIIMIYALHNLCIIYTGEHLVKELKYSNLKSMVDFHFWSIWSERDHIYLLPQTIKKLTKYMKE